MILIDTHVFVWIVIDSPRIGAGARHAIEEASRHGSIGISAITAWEIALLADNRAPGR